MLGFFTGTNSDSDAVRWSHNEDGIFTVGRAYKWESNQHNIRNESLWRKVWRNLAPTKVKCFTWLVVRRACLTHEVLKKKGKII